jgi:hypothetical protein
MDWDLAASTLIWGYSEEGNIHLRFDIEAAFSNGDGGSYGNGGGGGGGDGGKAGGYDNEDALGDNAWLTFGMQNHPLTPLLGLHINCQSHQMIYRHTTANSGTCCHCYIQLLFGGVNK